MKIPFILACLLCLAAGAFIGRKTAPETEPTFQIAPTVTKNQGSMLGGGKTPKVPSISESFDAQRLSSLLTTEAGRGSKTAFFARLDSMDSDTIVTMIHDLEKAPQTSKNEGLLNKLTNYLAAVDPLRALALEKENSDIRIFKDAFRQLGRQDPAAALKALGEWEIGDRRNNALAEIINGAAQTNPAATFALVKDLPELRNSHVKDLFEVWSQTDPQQAAQQALSLRSAGARSAALKEIGDEWAERDPHGALQFAKTAALSGPEKQQMISEALESYAKTNPADALGMLDEVDLLAKNRILPKVMTELMQKDPNAAMEYIDAQEDPYTKRRLMDKVAKKIAKEDPEQLLTLASQIPDLKTKGLRDAFENLAGKDFSSAVAFLEQYQDEPNIDDFVKEIAKGGAKYHAQEVLEWSQTLPEETRVAALDKVIEEMAKSDPQGAAATLELYASQGAGTDDNPFKAIAETWASTDPAGAAEWAYTLPEGEPREDALRSIAEEWSNYDPVAASGWISELPEGNQRDNAAKELIKVIRKDDPEAAFLWAQSIQNVEARGKYVQKAYLAWRNYDEPSAKAAISGADISAALKEELLNKIISPD